MAFVFRPRKTAQAAAELMRLLGATEIALNRLMPLLYLADRASLADIADPITGSAVVAGEGGPVPADVARLTRKDRPPCPAWDDSFRTTAGRLALVRDPERDELAECDRDHLAAVAARFAGADAEELARVLRALPEYGGTGRPSGSPGQRDIPFRDILVAVGFGDEADDILADAAACASSARPSPFGDSS